MTTSMATTTGSRQTPQDPSSSKALRAVLPFLVGGLSGISATLCIQPIDMVKVRLQLAGEGARGGVKPTPLSVANQVISEAGFLGLYNGISAALLRQVVYGTSRLGLFFTFEDLLKKRCQRNGTTYDFKERAFAGLSAGGLGALIGNPTEVALIRMQSDGIRPPMERANYSSAIDALRRIIKTEGILALWSGATPTVVRAMATNFGQLAFFSESKHQIEKRTNLSERSRTIGASGIAGFFAAFFSLPFDFVKTRLQRQTRAPDGTLPYKGMADCFAKVAREEGVFRFYRGFTTYFFRMAPHT